MYGYCLEMHSPVWYFFLQVTIGVSCSGTD
jgi:hypothetical protein